MPSTLTRHATRAGWALRERAVTLCLTSALGFGLPAGGYSAIDSLSRALDEIHRRGHLADLELLIPVTAFEALPRLDDSPGIDAAEARLVLPGRVDLGDGRQLAAVVVSHDATRATTLNRLTLLAGEPVDAAAPGDVVVERRLAEYNGCRVGDSFALTVEGRRQQVRVRGVADSPEFVLAPLNPGVLVPARGSLAVVFTPTTTLEAAFGGRPVNSLLFSFRPDADPNAATAALLARLRGRTEIAQVVRREQTFGSRMIERDVAAIQVFLPAVGIIFILSAWPVALFLGYQWVDAERRSIGTAMALGYGLGPLARAYLTPLAVIAGLALLGMGVCAEASLRAFGGGYARALGLLEPTLALDGRHLTLAAAGLLASVGGAMVTAHVALAGIAPVQALRSGPRAGPGRLVRGLSVVRAGAPTLGHALRNLARDAGLALATVLVVGSGLGLTIAFLSCETSLRRTVAAELPGGRWSVLVEFTRPLPLATLADLRRLSQVRATAAYLRGVGRLGVGPRSAPVIVAGLETLDGSPPPRMLSGRPLRDGDGRVVVLEARTAQALGADVGSDVVFQHGTAPLTATVVGVRANSLVPGETYVPFAFAQELLGQAGAAAGALVAAEGPADTLKRSLYAFPDVAQVVVRDEVTREVLAASDQVRGLIRVGAGFSVVLAVVYVFSSFSQALRRRRDEYLMLRVLGYSDRRVAAGIVAEVFLLGCMSLALAVPIARLLAQYLVASLSSAWVPVDLAFEFADVAVVLAVALALLPLAALPVVRDVMASPLLDIARRQPVR